MPLVSCKCLVFSNHLSNTFSIYFYLSWIHPYLTSHTFTLGHPCISLSHDRTISTLLSASCLPSKSLLPYLGYPYFNPIYPSIPTHPSKHPYLHHFNFLNVSVLDRPTLCPYNIASLTTTLKNLPLRFGGTFLSQNSRCELLFHPSCTNVVSDLLDLPIYLDNRPKVFETTSLLDGLCIKPHSYVSLMHHISELALQILCLLFCSIWICLQTSSLALAPLWVSSIKTTSSTNNIHYDTSRCIRRINTFIT